MKAKKFHKTFLGCAIFSAAIVVFGIVGLFVKGINFGIDFKPGVVEEVRIAPPAMEVFYNGSATVNLEVTSTGLDLVVSGTGAVNETDTFTYGMYPTVEKMANALSAVEGVSATVLSSPDADTYGLYTGAESSRLTSDSAFRLYVPVLDSPVTKADLIASLPEGCEVKELGTEENRSFQIRRGLSEDESTNDGHKVIDDALYGKFSAENIAIVKSDSVGSSFSSSLTTKAILLALGTLFFIWLYATIRFHWDFALGSIIALIHDCLIMFTFIIWSQVEFSTIALSAVLTIFGYSINATVVILDRVRENIKTIKTTNFDDILDLSLTETLSRSIITTVTTLFAAVSLLLFTSGSIHDFAMILTVGLISGCYSSIFISSGFISFTRRNWKGQPSPTAVKTMESEE